MNFLIGRRYVWVLGHNIAAITGTVTASENGWLTVSGRHAGMRNPGEEEIFINKAHVITARPAA